MVIEPESKNRLAFGPFEADIAAEELTREGVRIRLSGQPFQILRVLLARPGELVTREQLREQIWKDGTFVDFEHGLNAAMNKLRRVLGDSAENPRYVETIPGRGYRFIGTLTQGSRSTVETLIRPAVQDILPVRHRTKLWVWALTAGVTVIAFVLGWRMHSGQNSAAPWKVTRLTSDPGLSNSPAISRDGGMVVYSSNRNTEGQRDLYLIQTAGEQPLRLTSDGDGNTMPDFSPDGSTIVYHSDRDGGGIYLIPTFGGEPRLLARGGRDPRFSPDGSQVAYWIGGSNISAAVPGNGTVWIVRASGGPPRQVGADLTNARFPIWSPDGKSLLMSGYTSQRPYDGKALDWWLVAVDGSRTVKTGAYDAFVQSGLHAGELESDISPLFGTPILLVPTCWLKPDTVIFTYLTTDVRGLLETTIFSSTGKVSEKISKLTEGTGNEILPSCATPDRMAFSNVVEKRNIWSVPFDLNRGVAMGELKRVTEVPSRQEHASLSTDGRNLAFASTQAGKMNIWIREMTTGKETHLASMPLAQRYPVSNATGSRVAFSVFEQNGARSLYVSNPVGAPEKVCDGCFRATDWSRDQNSLLVFAETPYEVRSLDVTSHKQIVILKHPHYNLLYARYSPDNRWVSFTARYATDRSRIMIAPLGGTEPVPESEWIEITEEGLEDWANWSPDGKVLYFTSIRDGHRCFWGQRLDAKTHRPAGEPFAALHLHGRLAYEQGGWSAAGGRIAAVVREDTGNVWIMSREKTH